MKGHRISILDKMRKNRLLAELVGKKEFNPDSFGKALKATSGIFTSQNHPEWQTKKDVVSWLENTRKASDRSF